MGFLLDPNISTADIYTTLSDLWIEHDQITVLWEKTDLSVLPKEVALSYASIMGIQSNMATFTTTELSGPPSTAAQSILFIPTSTSTSSAASAIGSISLSANVMASLGQDETTHHGRPSTSQASFESGLAPRTVALLVLSLLLTLAV